MSPDTGSAEDVTSDPESRRRLLSVAYRIVGSSHDAEDAVHEGLARWHQLSDEQRKMIREPLAWLTRVVSRICLDELRSARARREEYRGIWLPEPDLTDSGNTSVDPADQATFDDTVSYAFLVALEKLTPAERVSFILHDVFEVPFGEIAETVGRSAAACRQLAVSARRHLAAEPRFDVSRADHDRVVAAFADVCRRGDPQRLVALLDPGVVSVADGGDRIRVARRPIVGASTVAAYLIRVLNRQMTHGLTMSIGSINGRDGIVVRDEGTIVATVDLLVVDGRIARIAMQINPEKLRATHNVD